MPSCTACSRVPVFLMNIPLLCCSTTSFIVSLMSRRRWVNSASAWWSLFDQQMLIQSSIVKCRQEPYLSPRHDTQSAQCLTREDTRFCGIKSWRTATFRQYTFDVWVSCWASCAILPPLCLGNPFTVFCAGRQLIAVLIGSVVMSQLTRRSPARTDPNPPQSEAVSQNLYHKNLEVEWALHGPSQRLKFFFSSHL